MAIHFLCPFGHKLVVPDHRAGKKGRCPVCYQRVIVPVPNPEPSGKAKKDSDAPDDQLLQAAGGQQAAPQMGLGFFNAAGQQMPMQPMQPMVPGPPAGQMPSMVPQQPVPQQPIPQQPMQPGYPYQPQQPGAGMFEPLPQQQQYPQQYQQPTYQPQQGYPPGYPQPGQPYRPQ